MTGRALAGIVSGLFLVVAICVGGLSIGAASIALAACANPQPDPSNGSPGPANPALASLSGTTWTGEQIGNAATIVAEGTRLHVPPRGWIIAVAVAMQESRLRNLNDLGEANDHDSLGLFQQRPSQGWGTPAQILDPRYAARKFYQRLTDVPGWQDLPLTVAGQRVQISAYPDAYAKWEDDAVAVVNAVGSGIWRAIPENLEQCVSTCPAVSDRGSSFGPSVACPRGEAVLARAATWLTAWNGGPVPYLSSGDPNAWFGGYRRDCSGFASMALGLPGPGLNTAGLAAQATPVSKSALSPGDLLINPAPNLAGHVVIFEHWTDATITSYVGYEQSGDGGTHHRVIPYPYFGGNQMRTYRWIN
jgi:hypothetical protein